MLSAFKVVWALLMIILGAIFGARMGAEIFHNYRIADWSGPLSDFVAVGAAIGSGIGAYIGVVSTTAATAGKKENS